MLEEIRTSSIAGVRTNPSFDLKTNISEICSGANSLGFKIAYLPLFEPLSNQDFINISVEDDQKLAESYSHYPSDTVIKVISYAVYKNTDSISKSKVILNKE